jgi:hypothetical protein
VQLRYETHFTSEEYVSQQAWQDATLAACPAHPGGGCSFARHGTYERLKPAGTRIARWYCRQAQCTFSLLPDCLAAQLSGSLEEVEAAVAAVEEAPSVEAAADRLRPDIDLPGALRWTRHRLGPVHRALRTLIGLLPQYFLGCSPTVQGFRQRLETEAVLMRLRAMAAVHLPGLPPPLGFSPPAQGGGERKTRRQHSMGPDPPAWLR